MAENLDGDDTTSDEYRRSFKDSRMSDSLSMACDYHYDPFCEVCYETRKRNIQHEGFCKDCVQFLCEDCLRVHRKLQGTRGHVIQRGDDMPRSMADKPPKFDYCNVHQQSRKDQFCGTHRILLCSQCVPLQHKKCPVESVDDACKSVPSSEIDTLYDKVNDFKTNLSSVVAQININFVELEKQKVYMLKEVQDMKDKTIAKIDKLFQEMTSEIISTYKAQKIEIGRSQNKLNDIIVNLEGTLNDIDKTKGKTVDTKVFLKVQDILDDVKQYISDAEKLRPSAMNVNMSFIYDKRMKEFLKVYFKMGSISLDKTQRQVAILVPEILFPISPAQTTLSQIKAQKLDIYNVQLDDEIRYSIISGMVITNDGRRLLADWNNDKIKLFSRDMKLLGFLSLSTKPSDIAVTGDREAVVSSGFEEKLLILDISDRKMSIKGTVKLPFRVTRIATYKDKLVVTSLSTAPACVKLIDLRGRVFWTTDTDQQKQPLFSWPRNVTCYDDGGSAAVIVSDDRNDTLTVLNADTGDVITRRHVKGWVMRKGPPGGVATDRAGNVYVCYRETNEVAVLTKDLSREKVLLSKRDGLSGVILTSILYNALDHQLLVSYHSEEPHSESCSAVICFKLQYLHLPMSSLQ